MSDMTWNEFKKNIDDQMEAKGISKDSKIWYIDITYPDSEYSTPDLRCDDSKAITIS